MSNTLSLWNTAAYELHDHIDNLYELDDVGIVDAPIIINVLSYFAKAFADIVRTHEFNPIYQKTLMRVYKHDLRPYVDHHHTSKLILGDFPIISPALESPLRNASKF